MEFKVYMNEQRQLVEQALNQAIKPSSPFETSLAKAMQYSLDAGGKRLRPILLLETLKACDVPTEMGMDHALALEMIHTYSLIHDDLPAMDNDDFRRGKPTNHKVFGEALAILAGDGLLNTAFELMINKAIQEKTTGALLATQTIAQAAGVNGMIGGQVIDMESENSRVSKETLTYIHVHKTGALLSAPLVAGAQLAGASMDIVEAFRTYGYHIGLAFQITDDILDITGDQEKLGKDIGSDVANDKTTYPSLYGLEVSKTMAKDHIEKAKAAISFLGPKAAFLNALATFILERDH